MKKIILSVLALAMLLSAFSITSFAEGGVNVIVNGEALVSDVSATMLPVYDANGSYTGDRTMLPLRAISEKLNFDVFWDALTEGIVIYRKNQLIHMWIGKPTAFLMDGLNISKGYTMDVLPQIIEGRTLVPVRAIAELLGAEVNWDGETKTVSINLELGELEDNAGVSEGCQIYGQLLSMMYYEYEAFTKGTLDGVSGKIVLESGKELPFKVYPELAPATAGQFIKLAKEGAYNNTIFHRVIPDFVAQGGGFDAITGEARSAERIIGEFVSNGQFNLIPHRRGTLSLARPDDYNAGSNQFFICQTELRYLDGYYASFGEITGNFEVIDEICNANTDESDKPIENIVIKEIIINE